MLLARTTQCVMPSGSPSPPYKANPKSVIEGLDLGQSGFSIGGIKREAYFSQLGYKTE